MKRSVLLKLQAAMRKRQQQEEKAVAERLIAGDPSEQHYSIHEVASRWGISGNTVRRLFSNEPGLLIYGHPERRSRRRYTTVRIPESVVRRVYERLLSQRLDR